MVARRVRAHDGVSSPSLDVPAGRRWSRTKASTGPSYFGNKKKQSISHIVIKPLSIVRAIDEGLTLETSAFKLFIRWSTYVLNSVLNTKLPALLSHRRSTTVS